MKTTVRSATLNDLHLVADHYGSGDTPWDPFGDVTKLRAIPIGGLMIAEVGGEYAGFLYWFEGRRPWFDADVERYAQIEEVQVLGKYRRQGVGRLLLESAFNQIAATDVDAIYVETTEENATARHLYESAGFRPMSRILRCRTRETKS